MNEAETRAELIDPALREAGWGVVVGSRVRREYIITLGRLQGAAGKRNKQDIADYVLEFKGRMVAVVEAKKASEPVSLGLGQAKKYADKLKLRHAYSTNGKGIYAVDMLHGREGDIPAWPTPDELWGLLHGGRDSGSGAGMTAQAGGGMTENAWTDRFGLVPFEDKSGSWQPRYYQDIAIQRVLDSIAKGKDRILLTLATGTGKTAIAFQIAWKLFEARWNLKRDGERRPRILFLADRNILADQAYNAFSAFPEDALVRIKPDSIKKKGKVPTNGSVFFTIFQTFLASAGSATEGSADANSYPVVTEIEPAYGYMYILACGDGSFYVGSTKDLRSRLEQHRTGEGSKHTAARPPVKLIYYEGFVRIDEAFAREKQVQGWTRAKKMALIEGDTERLKALARSKSTDPEPVEGYFGEYPADFFDFIVIDECHRGGAIDESSWRAILEYFKPAVQLGLTATPKRDQNVDTYKYFGDPVYIYSLKEGINDGFLTPFKLHEFTTTLDEYTYVGDDTVTEGEAEQGRTYTEAEMNRIIEIKAREEYRVRLFMDKIDQRQKTLVFCATQDHALAVRDLINQYATSTDPNYCHRVTADDGKIGEQHLRDFQDNERSIPTILTTSQKLSTGVDARNVRNIVLMRPVNSMIEFKQIVGRGTRLFEGKDYFTIYDFTKAHEHFKDPEWDGEPMDPEPPREPRTGGGYKEPGPGPEVHEPGGEDEPRKIIRVKLADGKERQIQHTSKTSFWNADGVPISAEQFIKVLFGELPQLFKNEVELRAIWGLPDTRSKLLEELSEKGFSVVQLEELQRLIDAEKSDLYDVLVYIAYNKATQLRAERATAARTHLDTYTDKQRAFLDFVLDQYVKDGVKELDLGKLPPLLLLKYKSLPDAAKELGDIAAIRETFVGFQRWLYG